MFDEYPVENFHSILQGQTRESDGSDMLQRKAKALDEIKSQASCFASVFDMPRKYSFSRDKLEDLKLSAVQFICNGLRKIKENPGSAIIVQRPKWKMKKMTHNNMLKAVAALLSIQWTRARSRKVCHNS